MGLGNYTLEGVTLLHFHHRICEFKSLTRGLRGMWFQFHIFCCECIVEPAAFTRASSQICSLHDIFSPSSPLGLRKQLSIDPQYSLYLWTKRETLSEAKSFTFPWCQNIWSANNFVSYYLNFVRCDGVLQLLDLPGAGYSILCSARYVES